LELKNSILKVRLFNEFNKANEIFLESQKSQKISEIPRLFDYIFDYRVIHEISILKIPGISYFSVLRRTKQSCKIERTVLETRLKMQETTYGLVYKRILVSLLRSISIGVFLELNMILLFVSKFGVCQCF
jgi:hypothetical protein